MIASLKRAVLAMTVVLFIGMLLAFFSAPVFLGFTIITASVVATVTTYALLAFTVTFLWEWLRKKNAKHSNNQSTA
jgi:amino acid transporter